MSDFDHQIFILREVEKARKAIKRKYDSIKSYKIDSEKGFNQSFKPIIELLNKLVANENVKSDVKKEDQVNRIKKEEKEEQNFYENYDQNYDDENTASSFETSDLDSEEDQNNVTIKKKDEVKEYLDLLNKGKNSSLDTVYGVRKMHDNT